MIATRMGIHWFIMIQYENNVGQIRFVIVSFYSQNKTSATCMHQ